MKIAILTPILVGIAIIAVVVVGSLTGWNFNGTAKGGILENATAKLLDAKTFETKGRIEINIKGGEKGLVPNSGMSLMGPISFVKVFSDISSVLDQTNKNAPKSSSRAVIGIDAQGIQMSSTIETISANKKAYIKIVSIPPMLLSFIPSLSETQNTWLEVDLEDLKKQYEDKTGVKKESGEIDVKSKEFTQKALKLLLARSIFKVEKNLGSEKIGDITAKHYLVKADKEEVKKLVYDYQKLAREYVPEDKKQDYDAAMQKELKDFPNKLDQVWKEFGGINLDIWIGPKGKLTRIKFNKTILQSQLQDAQIQNANIESINFMFDFTFSKFNQKTNIKIPETTKPIQEFLSSLLTSFIPENATDKNAFPKISNPFEED